jgi:hypothetical protein
MTANVLQVAAGQPAFLPTKDIKKRLAGGNLLCAPCMSMTHLLSSKAKKVKNTNLFLLNKRQVK